ncbi:MAG TPA: ORF6N domain-containing protein [Tepidisphaeraceae bacterium]
MPYAWKQIQHVEEADGDEWRHRLLERLSILKGESHMGDRAIIPVERIEGNIFLIRGEKVMLDSDLAELYGESTKRLNEAVRRNPDRFPSDFMFQLTVDETENLRSQIATSKARGGRRYLPYAFTEQGVAMLSSVLRSKRAVQVNVQIMRTFVKLRQMLSSHAELARKLELLEQKYDRQFKVVFDAIRMLMEEQVAEKQHQGRKRIGYASEAANR